MRTGLNFKIQRITLGIKGIDMAAMLGLDQSYISKMENGKAPIPTHVYTHWVKLLGMK